MSQLDDLTDIKRTVHAIREEQHKQDVRVTRLESRQDAQADLMAQEHRVLHEKIDGVYRYVKDAVGVVRSVEERFIQHDERENEDRRKLFWMMAAVLVSVLGFIGAYIFGRVTP